jgi:hypothetical protein
LGIFYFNELLIQIYIFGITFVVVGQIAV